MTRSARHWPGPGRAGWARPGGLRAAGWRPGWAGEARPSAAVAAPPWGGDAGRPAAAPGLGRRRGLLAYPAQSNFSGVQHPLRWIQTAHEHGYDVLLDAAAYLPSNRLDLSVVKPDFVPVSWYKVFGYPTGVGCLIARREALGACGVRGSPAGRCTWPACRATGTRLAPGEARFEDGTVSFLQIPDVEAGLSWVNGIGMDLIHQRVMCLTGWLLGRLAGLRHGNGEPMARIYGPASTRDRGGTVAFNLLDPGGRVIDERAVAREPPRPGSRSVPGASATRAPARARSNSPRQTGAQRCGDAPGPWISTSTCSACPAAGRCAHRWAWPPTSTTWSGSWHSWR